MLFLSQEDVSELLDLDRLVDALAAAHAELSAGNASLPPRIAALVAERDALLGAMPVYLPSAGLVCKLVTLFPHNGARVLAIIGTGVQAHTHARAIPRVRDIAEIRVAGRDPDRVRAFADEIGATAASSYDEAIRGADIVAAATHAAEPVVRREWLSPGTHVNSVGLNPAGREVDDATVAEATLVVESRDSALASPPAGAPELVGIAPPRGHPGPGKLVPGAKPGRRSGDEVTCISP